MKISISNKHFSSRLKDAMAKKKITATELSKLTGISPANISNYVNGGYKAKQDNLYKLAVALDVEPAWLMGFGDPEFEAELNAQILDSLDTLSEDARKEALAFIQYLQHREEQNGQ